MIGDAEGAARRRLIYALLITVAAGAVAGRMLSVARVVEPYLHRTPGADDPRRSEWPSRRPEPTVSLGGNDRSRWLTIRALVDEGTYAIGRRDPGPVSEQNKYSDTGMCFQDGWTTLDKVLHPERQEFYSSKPPLLPTILAGEYWLIKHTLGFSITGPDGVAIRIILFTVNWLPLIFYWIVLSRLVERLGATEWSKLYVMAAGCFATYLTTFSIVLNNHTVASWSALFALYFSLKARDSSENGRISHMLAGLFAGFMVCNELPAAALAAGLFLLLVVHRPGAALIGFLPAAAIPIIGLLVTNNLALGEVSLAYSKIDSAYYNYPGSYWSVEPGVARHGIDWAWMKESRLVYAFHLLFGHHGLFSLSPIIVLALAGMVMSLAGGMQRREPFTPATANPYPAALLAMLGLSLTIIVLGFYLFVTPDRTHNYGGWTSGPRQLMWLTPLYLLTMLACLDRLAARRTGRILGYALLGISVVSVSYPAWNPWRHPWIYDFMNWQGWIAY